MTLEEVAEPARTAAQIVLDREWYTPGTLKALGGGKMGPPPFLALVFDDAKEEVMWFGQSAEGFGKRNKYCCLPRPAGSTTGRQLYISSSCNVVNRGMIGLRAGEEPNWWEQIKKEAPEMEQEETVEEEEVLQEEELDYDDEF